MGKINVSFVCDVLSVKSPENAASKISKFVIDSREAISGSLFFALSGNKVDGYRFLEDAFARGAIAAIVDKKHISNKNIEFPLIFVDDVKEALHSLAKFVVDSRNDTDIIAITGSIGKTTTKEILKSLLEKHCIVEASPGNHNSQLSMPLFILNSNENANVLITEMGMTHRGDIKTLANIASPKISVITQITQAHGENFSSESDIVLGKGEIFSNENTELGILPCDCRHLKILQNCGRCKKTSFAVKDNKDANYAIISCENSGKSVNGYIEFTITARIPEGKIVVFKAPLLHKSHCRNFFAAVIAAREFGMPMQDIDNNASSISFPPGRLQIVAKNGITFIDDSYNNACLQGALAAFKLLADDMHFRTVSGKKIAVISEMREQGQWSSKNHEILATEALKYANILICIGEKCLPMLNIWKKNFKECFLCESVEDIFNRVTSIAKNGDRILLKGSRIYDLGQILLLF